MVIKPLFEKTADQGKQINNGIPENLVQISTRIQLLGILVMEICAAGTGICKRLGSSLDNILHKTNSF